MADVGRGRPSRVVHAASHGSRLPSAGSRCTDRAERRPPPAGSGARRRARATVRRLAVGITHHHDLGARRVPQHEVRHHQRHDAHGPADLRTVALERPLRALDEASHPHQMAECQQVAAPSPMPPPARRRRSPLSAAAAPTASCAGRAEPAAVARRRRTASVCAAVSSSAQSSHATAGGLEELDEPPREVRVVLAEPVDRRLAVAVPAQQPPFAGLPQVLAESSRRRARPPAASRARRGLSTSTRAARANAAIIRPFHAVRTLSSRCGRGRVGARVEQHLARPRQRAPSPRRPACPSARRRPRSTARRTGCSGPRTRPADRRARCRRPRSPNRRPTTAASSPEEPLDFAGRPDVERALALFGVRMAGDGRPPAVRRRGLSESASSAEKNAPSGRGQVAQHVVERVFGDRRVERRRRWPGRPRGTRGRAAPGRRASSRNAAPATRASTE